MSSTPNGNVVRFEIPGYGITEFRPRMFSALLADMLGKMTIPEIVRELRDMGWDYGVMEEPGKLTLLEWIAIYGESTGMGMD